MKNHSPKTTKKPAKKTAASKPEKRIPTTLADLGLTPERAWASHYIAADDDIENHAPHRDGLARGVVRVLHESFSLLVLYVAGDLVEDGAETSMYVGDVVVVAATNEHRAVWRTIGYLRDDGHFVDYLDVLAGNYLDPMPRAARKAVA